MPSCHPHLVFSRLNLQLHPVAGEPDLALALGDLRPQHVHHLHQATINQLMRNPVAKFYVSSTTKKPESLIFFSPYFMVPKAWCINSAPTRVRTFPSPPLQITQHKKPTQYACHCIDFKK